MFSESKLYLSAVNRYTPYIFALIMLFVIRSPTESNIAYGLASACTMLIPHCILKQNSFVPINMFLRVMSDDATPAVLAGAAFIFILFGAGII